MQRGLGSTSPAPTPTCAPPWSPAVEQQVAANVTAQQPAEADLQAYYQRPQGQLCQATAASSPTNSCCRPILGKTKRGAAGRPKQAAAPPAGRRGSAGGGAPPAMA